MELSLRAQRALFIALSIMSLAGCHGGGGDDDDDDDDDIGGVVDDEDAAGIWAGTMVFPTSTRTFRAMVAPNGEFNGVIFPSSPTTVDSRTLLGTGDVTGTSLSATGMAFSGGVPFTNGGLIAPLTVTAGRVTEHVSMTGTFTAGGEVGTFTLSYQSLLTNRGASLQTLAGTYSLLPNGANVTATVSIDANGAAVFNPSTPAGCVGNGNFAVITPALNMYSWTMTLTGCTNNGAQSGLAVLDDYNGTQRNLLAMYGSPPARTSVFVFVGAK